MQPPRIPDNEAQRLDALRASGLLDTPAETRFDRLTDLAQQIFNTPIVLISLIDSERQWFKSRQGLDACETGRDISFCGHAILSAEIFCIDDAFNDSRFADNPLVLGPPFIRFYAGAPLHSASGQCLGTLCLIDTRPRHLTAAELNILRNLADCVEHEISNQQAQRQHDAMLMLNRITSLNLQDPQMLLRETLALGCQYLKLADGVITEFVGADSVIRVLQSTGGQFHEGQHFFSQASQTDHLLRDSGVTALADLGPASAALTADGPQLRAYIGVALHLDGQRYGSLSFADRSARSSDFSQLDREFVSVLGDWVNSSLRGIQLNRALQRQQALNEAVAQAQTQFIKEQDRGKGFDALLSTILELSASQYGFISAVVDHVNAVPALEVCALADLTWDSKTRLRAQKNKQNNLNYRQMLSLSQSALRTGEPLLHHTDASATPTVLGAAPAWPHWLTIPVRHDEAIVALIGLANATPVYDQNLIDFLQPVTNAIGQLINAGNIARQHSDSELRLANIIEGTHIGTWECHIPTGKTSFNARWAEMLGYTLEELQPTTITTWLNLCHPDEMQASAAMLAQHFRGELPHYDMTARLRHKNGHWIWVRDRGCVVSWSADGAPLVMAGSHQDVTMERSAEEKLAHAYALLDLLFIHELDLSAFGNYFQYLGDCLIDRNSIALFAIAISE